MPPINKDGTPRRKPGKPAHPADVKTDRLVLRVHPDLLAILTNRSKERGITRSQYVEKLLIGWSNLDPRNPRLDLIGKVSPTAPVPAALRDTQGREYARRWEKFCDASVLLFGSEPPKEWYEEDDYYAYEDLMAQEEKSERPRGDEPPEDEEEMGPSAELLRKKFAKLAPRDRKPKGT